VERGDAQHADSGLQQPAPRRDDPHLRPHDGHLPGRGLAPPHGQGHRRPGRAADACHRGVHRPALRGGTVHRQDRVARPQPGRIGGATLDWRGHDQPTIAEVQVGTDALEAPAEAFHARRVLARRLEAGVGVGDALGHAADGAVDQTALVQ
jgi:hypothetical protein